LCVLIALRVNMTGEAEEPAPPRDGWRLLLEPGFMHRPVAFTLANAKRTVIAPAQLMRGEYSFPTKETFEATKLDDKAILGNGLADEDLAGVKPRYVRDRRNVIVYAELHAERPIIASAVLARGLIARFRETLGDALLVVVPNRFTAYLFPAIGTEYQQYAPMAIEAYRATPFPVSLEVFQVTADGWKTIGIFEDR
jgi:hypothetical protein